MKLRKYQGLLLISWPAGHADISPDLHSQEPYFHLSAEGYKHRSSVAGSHIKSQLSQARRTVLHRIIKKSFVKQTNFQTSRTISHELRDAQAELHRVSALESRTLASGVREKLTLVCQTRSPRMDETSGDPLWGLQSSCQWDRLCTECCDLSWRHRECIMDSAFLLRSIPPVNR